MVAGVVFIANSFFMEWFGGTDNQMAGISAFIGAMILGFPILRLAVKDITRGMLPINELVAIAFLAAIASGESQLGGYQTAGIGAFFMLLGELIEHSETSSMFLNPQHNKTEMYIQGRYG